MTPSPNLIDEIEDALASKTEEKRAAALWRITDLFIAGSDSYTEDHVTLFDDVIGRLAATIETNARARLSTRLARVPNAGEARGEPGAGGRLDRRREAADHIIERKSTRP